MSYDVSDACKAARSTAFSFFRSVADDDLRGRIRKGDPDLPEELELLPDDRERARRGTRLAAASARFFLTQRPVTGLHT